MTAPTLDDVRAWLTHDLQQLERYAPGRSDSVQRYAAMHRLALAALDDAERVGKNCQWRFMDWPESGSDFETECGKAWSFNDGGIVENDVRFCNWCGGRVLPPPPPEPDEDEDDDDARREGA